MKKRIEELVNFINKYGEDYLEDGTKNRIIEALKNEDEKLALKILNSIDKQWVERAKEIEKFYIFTEWENVASIDKKRKQPFYKSSYMDSASSKVSHIPVLKRVRTRTIGEHDLSSIIEGWEI